jgi:ketosteroid isomerase-like protein
MTEHPHLAVIRRYYEGCSTADVALMRSTLADDAVHYFVEEPPIVGAPAITEKWLEFAGLSPIWTVDHGIASDDEAVIEWTMRYTRRPGEPQHVYRGAEWYLFRDGLIAEIRAYELVGGDHAAELDGYPYAERGYPMGA